MVEWNGLAKQFGRRRLFAGITGRLEPGRLLVVTGPNGSGKSTFLRIIGGLVRPDAGTVVRGNLSMYDFGYAAPDTSVYAELTGIENITFFARLRGVDPQHALEWLDRSGLRKAGNKLAGSYSSGMRQRLKLACAMIHEPAVLLLDEPTIALDSDGVAFVEYILASCVKSGKCIAVATNDAGEAGRWAVERLALDQ